jgi:hypothetical protein
MFESGNQESSEGVLTSNPLNQKTIQMVAEAKIVAAMEMGEFDHLPGFGKPFEFDDQVYDPNGWLKDKMKRETLLDQFAKSEALSGTN